MRKLMLIGGMSGFSIGMAAGFSRENGWPSMLLRSSIAAVAGGLLLKWWGNVCLEAMTESRIEKARASKARAAASQASKETQSRKG